MNNDIFGTESDDIIKQDLSNYPINGQFFPTIYSLGGDDYVYSERAIIEGGAGNNFYETSDFSVLSYRESKKGVNIDLKTGLVKNPYGGMDTIKGNFRQIWGSMGDDYIILDNNPAGYCGMGGHDTVVGGVTGESFIYVDKLDDWTIKSVSVTTAVLTNKISNESISVENINVISQFTGETKVIIQPRKLTKTIDQSQSYMYCVWNGESKRDDINQLVVNSKYDVINLGTIAPINPNFLDPKGEKILLAHTNITQSGFWNGIRLSENPNAKPSWMGGNYTNCPVMFSVQYWNPEWKQFIYSQIDTAISTGYDGICLDSCVPNDWLANNQCENLVYDTAVEELLNLIVDINSHIKSKNLDRPFYTIPNIAIPTLINQYPESIKLFSAVFNECLFSYTDISSNNEFLGTLSLGNSGKQAASEIATVAKKYSIPFFGNDYFDQDAFNLQTAKQSFEYYISINAIPTIANAQDPYKTIETGPFMGVANDSNPVLIGSTNLINFLSGGISREATIQGGNLNDYLYGGSGKNTIQGNGGNDMLISGAGKDKLTGGAGTDTFKFNFANHSTFWSMDVITDFKHAHGDKIDLSAIDSNVNLADDQGFLLVSAFSTTDATGQLYFDIKTHILYGSTDTDNAPELAIVLNGVKNLVVDDFLL